MSYFSERSLRCDICDVEGKKITYTTFYTNDFIFVILLTFIIIYNNLINNFHYIYNCVHLKNNFIIVIIMTSFIFYKNFYNILFCVFPLKL